MAVFRFSINDGKQYLNRATADVTMSCKCLETEKLTVEERIVPIPGGHRIGFGFRKDF
jgi:hypothetical protein